MKKIDIIILLLVIIASTATTSCSNGIDGLAYYMTGYIKMAPKGLSGNAQYVGELKDFYNQNLGDNGTFDTIRIDSLSIGYDYYTIKIRSTQVTDGDAISGINKANESKDAWINKLPSGSWDDVFSISCACYDGSNSNEVTWESAKNLMTGTWSGTTSDGKSIKFTITDTRTDENSMTWTNPCTMIYNDSTWTGTMKYSSKITDVNKAPIDSVTAAFTFTGDATANATLLLNVTSSASTCAMTVLTVKGEAIVNETEMEKGVAMKKEE